MKLLLSIAALVMLAQAAPKLVHVDLDGVTVRPTSFPIPEGKRPDPVAKESCEEIGSAIDARLSAIEELLKAPREPSVALVFEAAKTMLNMSRELSCTTTRNAAPQAVEYVLYTGQQNPDLTAPGGSDQYPFHQPTAQRKSL